MNLCASVYVSLRGKHVVPRVSLCVDPLRREEISSGFEVPAQGLGCRPTIVGACELEAGSGGRKWRRSFAAGVSFARRGDGSRCRDATARQTTMLR